MSVNHMQETFSTNLVQNCFSPEAGKENLQTEKPGYTTSVDKCCLLCISSVQLQEIR